MPADHIQALWAVHREAGWPVRPGPDAGELMTLDTVISGCVTYFLEEGRLDPQRVTILMSCLEDLDGLLGHVEEGARPYFARLGQLGRLLLQPDPAS